MSWWGKLTKADSCSARAIWTGSKYTVISAWKLITVYHPPEAGRHSYATFGWAGFVGAIAGMSSQGLTVHEANLEESIETFRAIPWVLRTRLVMELAANLDEARDVFTKLTNDTVGFNFHGHLGLGCRRRQVRRQRLRDAGVVHGCVCRQ
eukprot:EC796840.1.p1 GENE.EC796840.1~~EC796840.1.p1  ORF type:complete len:150 (+),score=25.87 EC796840.1:32-481(+)